MVINWLSIVLTSESRIILYTELFLSFVLMSDDSLTIIKVVSLKVKKDKEEQIHKHFTLNPDGKSCLPDGAICSKLNHRLFPLFGDERLIFAGNRSPTKVNLWCIHYFGTSVEEKLPKYIFWCCWKIDSPFSCIYCWTLYWFYQQKS